MLIRNLISPIMLMCVAGCTSLSTPYVRPDLPTGPAWSAAGAPEAHKRSMDQWWTAFRDPGLTRLVEEVVARNNDVIAAALRARRASLQADLAANTLFPKLNGSLSTSHADPLKANAVSTSASNASIGVSYEVDLWGRLAAQRDSASYEFQATAQDYEAARLATIGVTIETYFRIAHANQAIASAEKSLAYARQTQSLVKTQRESGAVSDLEIREMEQTVETQAARISELRQARLMLRNALTVLLNGAPSPVPEPVRLPRRKLPVIAEGLPADLLSRRPDLRAAEARLRAALKGVDATRVSFYPQISLTGALGTSSDKLVSFVSNPVATLGAGAALSFLNMKDRELTVAISRLQYEERVADFRTTLLAAFSDVANALGARANYAEQARRLRKAHAAAQEVERLTEAKYRAGATTLRVWLDSEERRRTVETALADVWLAQLVNESKLYRALGGSTSVNHGDDRPAP